MRRTEDLPGSFGRAHAGVQASRCRDHRHRRRASPVPEAVGDVEERSVADRVHIFSLHRENRQPYRRRIKKVDQRTAHRDSGHDQYRGGDRDRFLRNCSRFQEAEHFHRVGRTRGRRRIEALHHRGIPALVDASGVEDRRRRPRREQSLRRRGSERLLAGDHLVEDDAERVNVGCDGCGCAAPELRRHVLRRSGDVAGFQRRFTCQAEVCDHRASRPPG